MENTTFTGTVLALTPTEGISASTGKAWQMLEVHVENTEERYPLDITANIFGSERIAQYPLNVGDQIRLYLDFHTKLGTNNRRYNSIGIWKVDILKPTTQQPSYAARQPQAATPAYQGAPQATTPSWMSKPQQPLPQQPQQPSYAARQPQAATPAYHGTPQSQYMPRSENTSSNAQYVPSGSFEDAPF